MKTFEELLNIEEHNSKILQKAIRVAAEEAYQNE